MEKYCTKCGSVFKDENVKFCSKCGHELSERPGRQHIPKGLRHAVFKRDGYRCQECFRGREDGAKLEIDHIIPVAKGGTNEIDNLQTLCMECNRNKHTNEWIAGETDLTILENEYSKLLNQKREYEEKLDIAITEDDKIDCRFNILKIKETLNKVRAKIDELYLKKAELERQQEKREKKDKLFKKLYITFTDPQLKLLHEEFNNVPYSRDELLRYLVDNYSEYEINNLIKRLEEKYQNKNDLIECPHCKELNDKNAVRCKLCYYEFKQNDALLNLIKCPNCGELIKKNTIRCKHCNYYFKPGKVLPKNNIKKEGKINTNNQHKDSNIPSGKKICPECGRIINDYAIRCVSCNHHFKDSEDKKYKKIMNTIKNNVKFCCDCHNEINIAATKCTNCGSESFVYNKNIVGLKYFKIKFDVRAENPWQYIQITDDNKEYTIFAKSKSELKNKIIENHLPWDDKRVEERINIKSDKYYYPKKQSKDRKRYYGTDYDYDEPPSFLYYERDNPTEEELGYFR